MLMNTHPAALLEAAIGDFPRDMTDAQIAVIRDLAYCFSDSWVIDQIFDITGAFIIGWVEDPDGTNGDREAWKKRIGDPIYHSRSDFQRKIGFRPARERIVENRGCEPPRVESDDYDPATDRGWR
jgi:hypothetical protein